MHSRVPICACCVQSWVVVVNNSYFFCCVALAGVNVALIEMDEMSNVDLSQRL